MLASKYVCVMVYLTNLTYFCFATLFSLIVSQFLALYSTNQTLHIFQNLPHISKQLTSKRQKAMAKEFEAIEINQIGEVIDLPREK